MRAGVDCLGACSGCRTALDWQEQLVNNSPDGYRLLGALGTCVFMTVTARS